MAPENEPNDFVLSTYQRMQQASKGLPYKQAWSKRRTAAENGEEPHDPGPATSESETTWKPPPGVPRSRTGVGKSYWDPQEVSTVFRGLVRRRSWEQPLSLGTIIAQWPEIVGATVAAHSEVESFHDGKLLVRADSTAWAKQLQLLLPQVEKRVADVVGHGAVQQVIVHGPERPSWKHGKYTVKGKGPRDTYG